MNLPQLNQNEQKEVNRFFTKLKKSVVKKLCKCIEKNPHSNEGRTFPGRWITNFFVARRLRFAKKFLLENECEKAKNELLRALKYRPRRAEIWFRIAEVDFKNGDLLQAIRNVSCALELQSDFYDARILRGKALFSVGKLLPAFEDWEVVLKQNSENAEACFYMGTILSGIGYAEKAEEVLLEATRLDSCNFIYESALGKNYILLNEAGKAENHFQKAVLLFLIQTFGVVDPRKLPSMNSEAILEKLKEKPHSLQYYQELMLGLALSYSMQHRYAEVLRTAEVVLVLVPENTEAQYLRALSLYELERWEESLKYFLQLKEEHPEIVHSDWYAGSILHRLARVEEALPLLKKAVEQKLFLPNAVLEVLDCLQYLERWEELEEFCTQMLSQGHKWIFLFHARGSARRSLHNISGAIRDLQHARKLQPQNFMVLLDLANLLNEESHYEELLEVTRQILELQPGMLQVGLSRAKLLLKFNRSEEAMRQLEELQKHVSENEELYILKAQICKLRGELEAAEHWFSQAIELAPTHPVALTGRAEIYELQEKWNEAFLDVSAAIESSPNLTKIRIQRVIPAVQLEKYDVAFEDCAKFLERFPQESNVILLRGQIRMAMQQPEAAILDFQKALEVNPKNFMALIHSSEAKFNLGLTAAALGDVEKAIQIQPEDLALKQLKLHLLQKMNREPEALEYITGLIQEQPEEIQFHYHRGVILLNLQRFEDALPELELAVKKTPTDPQFHFAYAVTLNALFRHDEALEALNQVLNLQPDSLPALSEKAITYAMLGKPETALELIERVLVKDPKNAKLLNLRGTIYANQQRIEEAIEAFRSATEVQPDFFPALNNLGHLLAVTGKLDEGTAILSSAINENPNWPRPYLNRATILMKTKQLEEAAADIEKALEIARKNGDEDVLVDGIQLKRKLEILRHFFDSAEKFNDEDEWDLGKEFPDEFGSEDFNYQKPEDESSRNDEEIREEKDLLDFLNKHFHGKNLKMKYLRDFLADSEENSEEETEKDGDSGCNSEENEAEELDSDFNLENGWNFDEDSDEDSDEVSDEDFDLDFDPNFDEDSDEDSDEDLEDFNEEEMFSDEDEKDFDFSTDSSEEVYGLTSDFMAIEDFFDDEGGVGDENEVGKSLWPACNSEEEESEPLPLWISDENEDSEEETEVTYWGFVDFESPYKISATENFDPAKEPYFPELIKTVLHFLNEESTRKESPYSSENVAEEYDLLPPFVIYFPRLFLNLNPDELEVPESIQAVFQKMEVKNPLHFTFLRFLANRERFFEILTMVSEILDLEEQKAESAKEKHAAKVHKQQLCELMNTVTYNLLNEGVDMMLVFTDFISPLVMENLDSFLNE